MSTFSPTPPPAPPSDEEQGRVDLRYDQDQRSETVLARAKELELLGFSDEFIKDYRGATLVGANISVHERLDSLSAQGFKDPITLIEKLPQILGYSPENIQNKLAELRSNGFKDPIALIEKQPSILNYSPENIQNKLTALNANGFENPIRLIEKFPQILSYSPENINRRVRLFGRLVRVFDSPMNPVEMMEQETTLFGTKIDKLLVLARVAQNSLHTASEVDRKLIHDIIFANLEDVMLALEGIGEAQHSTAPQYTIQDILLRVKQIKAQKTPKDTKRSEIESAEYIDPKVKQRYFRGYPLKKDNI